MKGYQDLEDIKKKLPDETKKYLTILAKEIKKSIEHPLIKIEMEDLAFDILFMAYGRGVIDC